MNTSSYPRPFWVRLFIWSFLGVSLAGWLRFFQVLRQWDLLAELEVVTGPVYLAAGGVLWGLLGLFICYGLLTARAWAPWAARLAGLLTGLLFWLDRIIVWRYGSPPSNLVFAAGVTILSLIMLFWGLNRPGVKRYFATALTLPD